uniref:Band 7 domain-containing protein n=1 Tax=Ditylenchus dipsaci TaxID=166011 RepID=A0A915D4J5_9BILA
MTHPLINFPNGKPNTSPQISVIEQNIDTSEKWQDLIGSPSTSGEPQLVKTDADKMPTPECDTARKTQNKKMETHHSGIEEDRRRLEGKDGSEANIQNEFGICGWILTILSYILIFLTLPISACMVIKVVQEFERAVIFRLGRLLPGGAKGPGIFFVIPCIDTYRKVDLRVLSFEVPPQEILSKDSVTVAVDAVVYFRISNATISVTNVEDSSRSTKLLAQTTLRNILGTKTLAEMLSDREAISLQMQATLDEATEPWGVKVERVEVKDVRLPVQLQRAMAAEAEAAREARAKVIVAEGEQKASRALKEAAEVIAQSPQALQLRYLQTLSSISAEKNSTIIFPFPIDLLSSFLTKTVPKPASETKTTTPSYSVFNRIALPHWTFSFDVFFFIFLLL